VITDPIDDVSGSIGIAHDTAERFPDLPQVWRLMEQRHAEDASDSALTDVGIVAKRGVGRGIVENDTIAGTQNVLD
jgi:hypothetical protein